MNAILIAKLLGGALIYLVLTLDQKNNDAKLREECAKIACEE